MVRLTKSFRLLRFLNKRRGPLSRAAFGALGWCAAILFTARPVLAADIARKLRHDANMKDGLRRLGWYGSRSWMRMELLADPVFDFAAGASNQVLSAQSEFLASRGKRDLTRALDQLTILSAADPITWDAFGAQIDHVLKLAVPIPELVTRPAGRAGDFPVNAAAKALADFADLFPNSQIPWFVISGTFLGLVRESGFLAHDYDIDLGVHADAIDIGALIATAQSDPRFFVTDLTSQTLQSRDTSTSRPVLVKLVHNGGVHIDVFVHYTEGAICWHGSQVHRWDNSTFELDQYDFAGVCVFGPKDADRYLRENYGDWRTPVKDFNPSFGTPNLRVVQNTQSLTLAIKRFALARRDGLAVAGEILSRLCAENYLVLQDGQYHFDPKRFDVAVDAVADQR